jgi:hypothetical protein
MAMPMPVPHTSSPCCARPSLSAAASLPAMSGIVDGIGGLWPKVDERKTVLVKHGLHAVLQLKAGMIGRERDYGTGHSPTPLIL